MDGAHPVPQCLAPNAPEAEANGLLARLLRARLAGTSGGSASDGGGGTGSNAALSWRSAGSDLEEPLLAAEAGEAGEPQQEQQRELQQPPPPKRWPQLRRGSISTRRRSPVPPATPAEESPFLASAFLPGAAAPQDLGGKAAAAAAAGGVKGEAVPGHRGGLGLALSAGLVNSIISLPIMLSFAAIIFRDPFFQPHMGALVKLVFLSSAIHQAAFALRSSMPFAVGQVQDVGLIFISAMATDVVARCMAAGAAPAATLATTLVTLTLATGVVGALIVAVGALKLASLVQFVPLPVVGGYLAFVGAFCLLAGLSLASGVQLSTPVDLVLLLNRDALIKLAPAVALIAAVSLVISRVRSPYGLPALLAIVPAAFYAVLLASGHSLADARAAGWVSSPQPGEGDWKWWQLWELYGDFPSSVVWSAMPGQVTKLLALFFVVAFGSSMDIAAIQTDVPSDLDFNAELVTVGVSNVLSAVAGVGLTGSYVFSQTLFSLRLGVDSCVMGLVVSATSLAIFAVPFNCMAFLPSFYFGGLLAWIGYDILKDWLFIAAKRVAVAEYCLLVSTFACVLAFGLEGGIGAGAVLSALHFAYSYSRVSLHAFTVVPSRSGAVRPFDQRVVLSMFSGRSCAISLSGFIFFGSSITIVDRAVQVAASTLEGQPHMRLPPEAAAAVLAAVACPAAPASPPPTPRAGVMGGSPSPGTAPSPPDRAPFLVLDRLPSIATLARTYDRVRDVVQSAPSSQRDAAGGSSAAAKLVAAALAASPRYLILDFRRVQGLDATAARSFVTLHRRLQRMGIQLAVAHIPAPCAHIRGLLEAQGLALVQPPDAGTGDGCPALVATGGGAPTSPTACLCFPTMESAVQHAEEAFLAVAVSHGLCQPQARRLTLAQVLQAHLELPRFFPGSSDLDYEAVAARMERFTIRQQLLVGETVFGVGDDSEDMWIVESGTVTCAMDLLAATVHSRAAALPPGLAPRHSERPLRYAAGGVFGDLDFFLQRPRSFVAVVQEGGSAWRFSRAACEGMAAEDPASLALLLTLVLRSTSLSVANMLEVLERSAASDR